MTELLEAYKVGSYYIFNKEVVSIIQNNNLLKLFTLAHYPPIYVEDTPRLIPRHQFNFLTKLECTVEDRTSATITLTANNVPFYRKEIIGKETVDFPLMMIATQYTDIHIQSTSPIKLILHGDNLNIHQLFVENSWSNTDINLKLDKGVGTPIEPLPCQQQAR